MLHPQGKVSPLGRTCVKMNMANNIQHFLAKRPKGHIAIIYLRDDSLQGVYYQKFS